MPQIQGLNGNAAKGLNAEMRGQLTRISDYQIFVAVLGARLFKTPCTQISNRKRSGRYSANHQPVDACRCHLVQHARVDDLNPICPDMSIDYPKALKAHLDSSVDPLWAPVVMTWLERFDGWWCADRDELRNPAYAIALEALQRDTLRQDAPRTAQFLAHLPFNRWHAVTVAGEKKWNPLEQTFEEFRSGCLPQPIVTFVAPDFSDRRLDETAHWLWAAWRVQWIGKESPDA